MFLIAALALMTSAATLDRPALQVPMPSVYLPFVANYYPLTTRFGVDGKSSFDKMNTAGVTWLRLNSQLNWSLLEETEGVTDWSKAAYVETRLIDAAQKGLKVILVIQNAPTWAQKYPGSACGPIKQEKLSAFGDFLYKVVERYSQPPFNVNYYQIWNEPDAPLNNEATVYGCWGEDPDNTDETYGGKYYGTMLAQVYPQIKAANPNAQLVMGSLLMMCDPRETYLAGPCTSLDNRRPAKFFEGVLQTAGGAFDVVMFNSGTSYETGKNPVWLEKNSLRWTSAFGGLVDGKIDYVRNAMAAYGIDKPIVHSEAYFLDRPPDDPSSEAYKQFENQKA
ncbi:MAG: cellulase family glycosylhydrolase, partial [Bellilinea sp.]